LLMERKDAFSSKHPYFKHASWKAWVAYQAGKPVGRISAQVDQLHQQRYDSKTGFFGLIESPDDDKVFTALFETAERWLKDQGMQQVAGPFNLGINQEIGILIDGFDSPPYIMMGHSPRYYDAAIKNCGYQQAQDLLAYELNTGHLTIPRVMQSLIKRSGDRIQVRTLDRKNRDSELETMRDIFNDAWQNNWNFVPFTREEFSAVGKELLMILPEEFIQIASIDGVDSAFSVLLPNINEVIKNMNGHLFPFGWAKLLWHLKVKTLKSARVPLMGVRQKYQNTRYGPALAYMTVKGTLDASKFKGVEWVEMSWILDHNHGVRNIIESLGGEVSKRYRMYEKTL
jgi:hypothetical protein